MKIATSINHISIVIILQVYIMVQDSKPMIQLCVVNGKQCFQIFVRDKII